MHEALDLGLGADLDQLSQSVDGLVLGALRLIRLERLVLREQISKLVNAGLVKGLERLEYVGRLGIPLLGCRLQLGIGGADLLAAGLAAFPVQLVGLALGLLNVLGDRGQVGCHGVHVGDIFLGLEGSQRLLDDFLDAVGKVMVRLGDGIDALDDATPRSLEDAACRH